MQLTYLPVPVALFTRGRFEPASLIELYTSRTEEPQALLPCASSLETVTQFFHHRAQSKTPGPERGSRSALIVVAHTFSS